MFDSLKKKLSGWFSKPEPEKAEEPKKKKAEKQKKETKKTEVKQKAKAEKKAEVKKEPSKKVKAEKKAKKSVEEKLNEGAEKIDKEVRLEPALDKQLRGETIGEGLKDRTEEESKEKIEGVKITYFVHGTTLDNEKKLSTGQAHGELSELGVKQSKELSSQIKESDFEVVFCSDLKRAIDSAELSFKGKYKIIKDKRLRECNYGELNQTSEKKVRYSDHIKEPFPNGESLLEVEERIRDFLNYLYETYYGKHVAIVAHKAPQLAIEVLLHNKTWEEAIEEDWREAGKWQPGWVYFVKEILEKKEEAKEEKKTGFFGRIKKAFVGEEKEVAVEEKVPAHPPESVSKEVKGEVDKEVLEKKEEIVKAVLESEKKFEKEEVEIRAEELKEELEEQRVEKVKEEEDVLSAAEVEEEVEKKRGFFGKLAQRLTTSELVEKDFDEFFDEFEFTLLEHNVALGVVDKIRESLKQSLVGKKFGKKEVEQKILSALKDAISGVLVEPGNLFEMIRAKDSREPYVILFFGINGSGKTTSIAKLAWKLKEEGFSVVMAAGDTFRAASIEQLETHGERLGVEVIKSDYGKDPASVAFEAIAHARKEKKRVVLIDTAGRMYTRSNLMKEMEKIVKVSKPDLKIFVGESITGNDATEQARMFAETAGIDGIILSKADVDEKAGTILSVSHVTGKPIYFLGVGQNYEDLQEFSKKGVLEGLGLE